jgi:hypothetical protein
MGEEPPAPPRLTRVTQEPNRRTSRLWAPLTPPPPLRPRPRNRNASLSAQSDDSDMV